MAKYLMGLIGLGLFTSTLMAEVLRDPTMPPPQSGLVSAERLPTVAPPPMLQSITLGSSAKFAMINGQTVMLGGSYEDWTLIRLSANEAVLRAKDGKTKVLVMDYAIQKRSASAQPAKLPMRNSTKATSQEVVETTTRNNLTERPHAQVRVQAESLWVKQ
ncbi:hypothetical protein [Methylotenera sp. N17]|uniref:hypothetical protein n=1 Tax=Methylotenera sp. N17 TaxID=1502761 RepID=UPI00126A21FA|nr:hypothetical protein [Methylotenera sp. N17]